MLQQLNLFGKYSLFSLDFFETITVHRHVLIGLEMKLIDDACIISLD